MLHTLTEDFAAFLSEVTHSDLDRPVPSSTRDVGDLYLHMLDQHHNLAAALGGQPIPQPPGPHNHQGLNANVDPHYGSIGLEGGYRHSAQLVEHAFTATTDTSRRCQVAGFPAAADIAALYEEQIRNTVIHTWDLAQALGFAYQPGDEVAQRVLRTTVMRETPDTIGSDTDTPNGTSAFASVLTLSGRTRLRSGQTIASLRGNAEDTHPAVIRWEPYQYVRRANCHQAAAPVLEQGRQRPALVNGDLALTATTSPTGSVSVEVARRQPDGSWLWAVDQPMLMS